jgi:hypothetical protein
MPEEQIFSTRKPDRRLQDPTKLAQAWSAFADIALSGPLFSQDLATSVKALDEPLPEDAEHKANLIVNRVGEETEALFDRLQDVRDLRVLADR